MIAGLIRWWWRRQRNLDLIILWPACKHYAPDIQAARTAFAVHALQDRAWLSLGDKELHRQLGELK